MASMRDVARYAGVSSATVSRVLGGKPNVSPAMRKRVLEAVQELGYRPNRVARSLRVQQSNIIGLIVTDVEQSFFTTIARAVEDVAIEHDYTIFLANTDENLRRERLYLDLMQAEHVAGVIIAPARDSETRLEALITENIPVVAIDRRIQSHEVDTILADNVQGTRKLVSHLIEHGHRRIGAIVGLPSITTGWERQQGYRDALQAHDIPVDRELVKPILPREQDAYEAMKALWQVTPRPTAIFAGTEVLAAGTLRAIRELGLSIPDDVALASFDDPFWSTLVRPAISCVRQPVHEMGHLAAEMLMQRLANPERSTREVVLKSELIIRQSCGCHNS